MKIIFKKIIYFLGLFISDPLKVSLTYEGPWLYWLLFFVSVFSLIFTIEEIISGGVLTRKLLFSPAGKVLNLENLNQKVGGWWKAEE